MYMYTHDFVVSNLQKNMLFVWLDPLSILMLDLEGKLLAQALKFTDSARGDLATWAPTMEKQKAGFQSQRL